MAVTYGFYNSLNKDRVYNAEQMSAIFDGVITDGVFASIADHMMPVAGTGLQVIVKPGKCWFNHTWTLNDAELPLTIATADVSLTRIDAIVVEINSAASIRANSIKVVKGTPSANPAKPALTNTETLHQYALGYVKVTPGMTSVTADKIEVNVGKTGCPFVTSVLQQTDITDLFNQWNAEFNTWFANVQSQLSGNVAANLQRQIDNRVKISDKATDEDISNKTPDKWVDAEHGAKLKGYVYDETTKTYGHIVTTGIGFAERYNLAAKLAAMGEKPVWTYLADAIIGHFWIMFVSTRYDKINRIFVLNLETGELTKKLEFNADPPQGTSDKYDFYNESITSNRSVHSGNIGTGVIFYYDLGLSSTDLRYNYLIACWEENGDIRVERVRMDSISSSSRPSSTFQNYPLVLFDDFGIQPSSNYPDEFCLYNKLTWTKVGTIKLSSSVSGSSPVRKNVIVGNPEKNKIITLVEYVARNSDSTSHANEIPVLQEWNLSNSGGIVNRSATFTIANIPGKGNQALVPICYDDSHIYFAYTIHRYGISPPYYLYKDLIVFDISSFTFLNGASNNLDDYINTYFAQVYSSDFHSIVLARTPTDLYFLIGCMCDSNGSNYDGVIHANMSTLALDLIKPRSYHIGSSSDKRLPETFGKYAGEYGIPKINASVERFQPLRSAPGSQDGSLGSSNDVWYDLFFDTKDKVIRSTSDYDIPTDIGATYVGINPDVILNPDQIMLFRTGGRIYERSNKNMRIVSFESTP